RRDLITSIARSEKATQPKATEVDEALVRLRTVLRDYRRALTEPVGRTGASVLDATRQLTRMALLPSPPSTGARLSMQTLEGLARPPRRHGRAAGAAVDGCPAVHADSRRARRRSRSRRAGADPRGQAG